MTLYFKFAKWRSIIRLSSRINLSPALPTRCEGGGEHVQVEVHRDVGGAEPQRRRAPRRHPHADPPQTADASQGLLPFAVHPDFIRTKKNPFSKLTQSHIFNTKCVQFNRKKPSRRGLMSMGGGAVTRRKSAGVRVRGILDKMLGNDSKSKSCDDLHVL